MTELINPTRRIAPTCCSNCSVYGGADGAAQGACTLFPGKLVQAAGWCKSWSGLQVGAAN